MPGLDNVLLFVVASVLLVLTPGPNLLYLISRTLCQGRAAGLVSLAGTTTGFVVHILAAALGLSAVFVAVPVAYDALRWAGAALPAVARLGRRAPGARRQRRRDLRAAKAARRGAGEALPDGASHQHPQSEGRAVLPRALSAVRRTGARQRARAVARARAVQIVIALIGDTLFVLAAAQVARWLGARPAWAAAQRWVLGGVFAGIAAKLALDDRR